MSRILLVMRHAKSDWDTPVTDFERPLAPRGERDARRMGKWLAGYAHTPDWLVGSPARRAKDTLLAVREAVFEEEVPVSWQARIYEGTVRDLLGVLADVPARARTTLLVGHNPGLEELVQYLAGGDVPAGVGRKLMPTAAVAHLEMPADWSHLAAGAARWVYYMRPKLLGAD